MSTAFSALGIRSDLIKVLNHNGLTVATPVQEAVIPELLSGKDVIAQAQTGTGKTLAFVLPILEIINPGQSFTQALIITPTRELAIQITAEVRKLAPTVAAKVLAAYGGQDVEGQIHKLKGSPHIVVGTPGRLLDHLRRNTLLLTQISMLVLDEADQMLHMGFLKEVEEIIGHISNQRQTMLFSATIAEPIRKLAANYMKNPVDIQIRGKQVTLEEIKQIVIETTDRGKQPTLFRLIQEYQPYLAVVFCRTKIRVKKLAQELQANGFNADELHGDLSQAKRELVMKRFKAAKLQILVATDVAARGLDVEGVTHVFNYDIPHDGEDYIHRIGRTGRAGHEGAAITFATARDRLKLQEISRRIGKVLEYRSADTSRTEADNEGKLKSNDRGTGVNRGKEGNRDNRDNRANRGLRGKGRNKKGSRGTEQTRGARRTGEARGTRAGRDSRRGKGRRL